MRQRFNAWIRTNLQPKSGLPFTKMRITQVPTADIPMDRFRASAQAGLLLSPNQVPPPAQIFRFSYNLICYKSRSSKRPTLTFTLWYELLDLELYSCLIPVWYPIICCSVGNVLKIHASNPLTLNTEWPGRLNSGSFRKHVFFCFSSCQRTPYLTSSSCLSLQTTLETRSRCPFELLAHCISTMLVTWIRRRIHSVVVDVDWRLLNLLSLWSNAFLEAFQRYSHLELMM